MEYTTRNRKGSRRENDVAKRAFSFFKTLKPTYLFRFSHCVETPLGKELKRAHNIIREKRETMNFVKAQLKSGTFRGNGGAESRRTRR